MKKSIKAVKPTPPRTWHFKTFLPLQHDNDIELVVDRTLNPGIRLYQGCRVEISLTPVEAESLGLALIQSAERFRAIAGRVERRRAPRKRTGLRS